MNGAGSSKRRSARLSHDAAEDHKPPAKKTKVNGSSAAHTTTTTTTTVVSTKEQDGEAGGAAGRPKRTRKTYSEQVDGFTFNKGSRKGKEAKEKAAWQTAEEDGGVALAPETAQRQDVPPAQTSRNHAPTEKPSEEVATNPPPAKKTRRRLPTTPEREAAEKPVRRSKRLSDEHKPSETHQPSPHKPSHAKSHANHDRSPSPEKARPVTIEKKRKRVANGAQEEEEKIMRIALPFQDTPVIKRNREMRKTGSADGGHRRSSAGFRGHRASSLIDEGRGNALPHAEVPADEFFKHISADLTEPRRMRCLLGWCAQRALPSKPEAPKDGSAASRLEFQALQAARVIQEELAQDLMTKGTLSDWFSRDDNDLAPPVPLRKKPNPRNVANAAKAEELEKELERLKRDRAEWDTVIHSHPPAPPPSQSQPDAQAPERELSSLHPDLLDSPQRRILDELQGPSSASIASPTSLSKRLQTVSTNLEFTVDQFAHGIHALATVKTTAERLGERVLGDAAEVLEEREQARRKGGKGVDALDALRALGKIMNGSRRGR